MGGVKTRHVLPARLDSGVHRAVVSSGTRGLEFEDLICNVLPSDDVVEGKDLRTYPVLLKVANKHWWEVPAGLIRVTYVLECLGGITTCESDGEVWSVSQRGYQHTSLSEENFVAPRMLLCCS